MSALSFLGLAKKAGRVEVGDESVNIAARAGKTKLILTAADAGRSAGLRAENSGRAAGCPVAAVPFTKEELGAALGRDAVGVAAITDIGFAHAFAKKLHEEQGGLDDILETLAVLDARAGARRKELRRHERNVKRGKK